MDFSVVLVDEGRLDVTTKEVISASVATVESEFSLGKWSDKARIESAIGRYSIKQWYTVHERVLLLCIWKNDIHTLVVALSVLSCQI